VTRLRTLAEISAKCAFGTDQTPAEPSPLGIDPKTAALTRLAAQIAMGAPAATFRSTIDAALAAGADVGEVFGTVTAVAPTVGMSRLVAATVGVGLALGYDVDSALESPEHPRRSP
jgi:alkylhydroperoxidase/carboxymuconolactone decarboxylase family protein YurZ